MHSDLVFTFQHWPQRFYCCHLFTPLLSILSAYMLLNAVGIVVVRLAFRALYWNHLSSLSIWRVQTNHPTDQLDNDFLYFQHSIRIGYTFFIRSGGFWRHHTSHTLTPFAFDASQGKFRAQSHTFTDIVIDFKIDKSVAFSLIASFIYYALSASWNQNIHN